MKTGLLIWLLEIATSASQMKQYFIREPDNQTAIEGEQVLLFGVGGQYNANETRHKQTASKEQSPSKEGVSQRFEKIVDYLTYSHINLQI